MICSGLIPSVVQAQEIQTIKQGSKAPFDGVIYSKEAHAKLVAKLKAAEERAKAERELAVAKAKLEAKSELAKLKIDNEVLRKQLKLTEDASKRKEALLLEQIKERNKVPWYRTQTFAVVLTAVISTGIFVGSAYAYSQISK